MAKIWSVEGGSLTLVLAGSGSIITNDSIALELLAALMAMYQFVPLTSFLCKRDNIDPLKYSYKFVTLDGREWNQELFVHPNETHMTFSVTDMWALSEFVLQRPIRDKVVLLLRTHNLAKIEATWT